MNKEVKKFLNKGFTDEANSKDVYKQKVQDEFDRLMPSPEVLQAYEDVMPGTVTKLLLLMEKEQQHKHAMEQVKYSMQKTANIIAKIFAAFILIVIAFVTLRIAKDSLNHAVMFGSVVFLGIIFSWVLSKLNCLNKSVNKMPKYNALNDKIHSNNHSYEKSNRDQKDSASEASKTNYRKPVFKKK